MRTLLQSSSTVAMALLLAIVPSTSRAQDSTRTWPALPNDSVARAQRYTAWFYAGRADSLFAHYADSTRAAMGSPDVLTNTFVQLVAQAGAESSVAAEFWTRSSRGMARYYRIANFTNAGNEQVVLVWSLNDRGEITYLGLAPKSQVQGIDELMAKSKRP